MPFLKIEQKSSGTYLRITESYRDDEGKTRHRILHNLGKVSDYTPEQLRGISLKLFEIGGGDVRSMLSGTIEELGRYNYGYQQVYKKAFRYYGLDTLLERIRRKHKLSYNFSDAVLLMLLERLQEPCSKRSNYIHQTDYAALEPVYLQHLYRSLDKLADYNELIQTQIFQTGRDIFNLHLDVVFYDVTTLYFESSEESDEENKQLRKKGFSKDGKVGDTQVLFSMMIDKDKNPVGYQIFKGNTYEGHTLPEAIKVLKQRYAIDKIIIVADRGMMSKVNIEAITGNGFEFIVSDRLKNMPSALQEKLLDINNYQQEWIYTDNDQEQVKIRYTTLSHKGKTIIATYSEKRARKDRYDREKLLAKSSVMIARPELVEKKASRYFLKKKEQQKYELNQERIKDVERFDGFLAISTNNQDLATAEILDQYKQLFKIEHCFRSFKSTLEMRPMFHWTDKRIEGHICLCYMAYTLQHYILQKLQKFPIPITENILREMLDKMQLSLLQHSNEQVYLRSSPQAHETQLQQLLGVKPLPPMLSKGQLINYI